MASLTAVPPSDSSRLQDIMSGTFIADAKISEAEADADLLRHMDREMSKYESITARRKDLQKKLDQSTGSSVSSPRPNQYPSNKVSPSSKIMESNFNMDFLTAEGNISPATRSSMRSLVDGMSPASRKVLLESLIEKDESLDSSSSLSDSKKKSPLSSKSRRKSPGKRVKITPPRVSLTTSPSRLGISSSSSPKASSLTMLDFESSANSNEKGVFFHGRTYGKSTGVASPTEIEAQQLTAEIVRLEGTLEKLIESKAERQAEEAESEISGISDASSDRMYLESRRGNSNRRKIKGRRTGRQMKKKIGGGKNQKKGAIITKRGIVILKAYGLQKKGRKKSNNRRLSNRKKVDGWIISGDRPPVSDQRRFVVKDQIKRKKDREKELPAAPSKTIFEYDEVQPSNFDGSAYEISPRIVSRAIGRLPKSRRPTIRNIQKGRVGFTRTTANQKFRELEIQRRKLSSPRPEYASAGDRVFFLHHR
jgi:hypothetical protein